VLRFWRNPEFVRYLRAELRGPRAMSVALVAVVICTLVGLACWGTAKAANVQFFRSFHIWLTGIQYLVLGLWCAGSCGAAITRERELKNYDFLRTTRLTAGELLVGKVLGVPLIGYFAVACSLPVTIVTGILGGYSLGVILGSVLLMLVFALFVALVGLWLSMLLEKTSAAAAALFILFPLGVGFAFSFSPFPGFGAISVFAPLFSLYKADSDLAKVTPTIFGAPTHFLFLTLLLYATFGAWFALMLVRNLKKDREQIRLLSRWQAVGFAAFLNFLYYAFLNPNSLAQQPFASTGSISPREISNAAILLNAVVLALIGLATLTPPERLKVWWRRRMAGQDKYFSPNGLPWPWLAIAAALAYAMLAAEATGMRSAAPLNTWQLGNAAIYLLAFLVFITRDILFLQWCNLTRMKRPIFKGFLYLCLYYIAAGIIGVVAGTVSRPASDFIFGLTMPFASLSWGSLAPADVPGLYVGLALQVTVVVFLLQLISRRLSRPVSVPAAPTV
jgi:hypothetical protein